MVFFLPHEVRWLVRQVRPQLLLHIASFVSITAGSAVGLATPLILKWLIDQVLPSKQINLLLAAVVLMFLSYAARMALLNLGGYITLHISQRMALDLRRCVLRHLDALSADYHESTPAGAAMYPLKEPIDEVAAFAAEITPSFLRTFVAVTCTLAVMLTLNARTTLAILPLVPIFLLARSHFRRRIQVAADTTQQDRMAWSSFLQEHVSAIIPLQLLCRELGQERKAFLLLAKVVDSQRRLYRIAAAFTLSAGLTVAMATSVVVGYGGWCVLSGTLTLGGLVAFFSYLMQLFDPLNGAAEMYARAQKAFGSIRQIQSALALRPTVRNSPCAVAFPEHCPWKIELSRVRFAYTGQDGLAIPSLHIPAGELVAVAGANGAGKSTLAKLLVRFYDPHSGSIAIGEEDIRNIRLDSLRRCVCYLPQHPAVFDATVASNLRLARPSASTLELEKAVERVALTGWLRHLPQGLDHRVGPGGSHLSGGQRQRLAIARALLSTPRILILDEATSCLDPSAEEIVLDNLRRTLPATTIILISHRLATLARYKRVLILAGGRIVHDGPLDSCELGCDLAAGLPGFDR